MDCIWITESYLSLVLNLNWILHRRIISMYFNLYFTVLGKKKPTHAIKGHIIFNLNLLIY